MDLKSKIGLTVDSVWRPSILRVWRQDQRCVAAVLLIANLSYTVWLNLIHNR